MDSFFVRSSRSLFCIAAVTWTFAIHELAILADDSAAPVDLTVVSLDDLAARLDSAPRERYASRKAGVASYESILYEFIRRGGTAAEQILSKRLAVQDEKRKAARDAIKSLPEESEEAAKQECLLEQLSQDLELVTALRRIRKKPDPLAVVIDRPAELKAGTREPPFLNVALKNVDAEMRDVWIQHGGDYRSGRHARWRIHVWDSKGNLLPELPSPSGIGGGLFHHGALAFGETWEAQLPLASYVRIRTPGKYRIQLLYHDAETIANMDNPKDLDGLIVVRSEPFELNVEHGPKISIRLKAGSMEQARSLTNSLNEKAPLNILIGKYDEKAHSFISPKSPEGQLLAMQWQAVPALIEALEDEKLSFRKRAWILSLLFSITLEGDLNPMAKSDRDWFSPRGILPDYKTRGSLVASVTWNGGSSQGWEEDGNKSGGRENQFEQRAFAKQWLRFRDEYLDVQFEN